MAETTVAVSSKLRKGAHIAAMDGSPALHAAAAQKAVPTLKGVSHIKHLFTPLSTIQKTGLSRHELLVLRNLVKQKCCIERAGCFVMVGGDQVAESLAGVSKGQLRRHALLKNSKDPIEHRNVLAVHYIHKNPGLLPVLQALKRFRKLAETSLVAPAKMFDTAPWEK